MEKTVSKAANSRLSCISNPTPVRMPEDRLAMPVEFYPALESGETSSMPIVVLVPDHAAFGRVMAQLLPDRELSGRGMGNVMQMPTEWIKAFPERTAFSFGEVTVDANAMEVRRNGKPVTMPLKEFSMLVYMIKNPGKVIPRDVLLNEVWGYQSYPCTRTVDNHVLRLRKKLEVEPSRPKHFLTIHSAGYKFLP